MLSLKEAAQRQGWASPTNFRLQEHLDVTSCRIALTSHGSGSEVARTRRCLAVNRPYDSSGCYPTFLNCRPEQTKHPLQSMPDSHPYDTAGVGMIGEAITVQTSLCSYSLLANLWFIGGSVGCLITGHGYDASLSSTVHTGMFHNPVQSQAAVDPYRCACTSGKCFLKQFGQIP